MRYPIRQILKTGDLAYLDTMAGLVACRVLAIRNIHTHPHVLSSRAPGGTYRASSDIQCKVQITATKPACYKHGEVLRDVWSLHVIPRKSVYTHRGHYRIGQYDVQTDTESES